MKITRNQLRRLIKEEISSVLESEKLFNPLDAFAAGSSPKMRRELKPIEPPKREPTLPKDIKAKIVSKLQYGWERAVKEYDIKPRGRFGFIVTLKSHPMTDGPNKGKFNIWLTKTVYDKSNSDVSKSDVDMIIKHAGTRARPIGFSDKPLDGDFKTWFAGGD